MKYTTRTRLFSSVSGGPLERLAQALKEDGVDAEIVSAFSPMKWRQAMRKSTFSAMLARFESFIGYPFQCLWNAIRLSAEQAPDKHFEKAVCVVTTNPFFLPHWMLLTKPLHRCDIVALMYDMYPDALEASGKKVDLFARVWTAANRCMLRHADAAVYLGEAMQHSAENRYAPCDITTIIPTGAFRKEFSAPSSGLPEELVEWAKDKRIFSYVGNMGLMHEVDTLETALKRFLEEAPEKVGFIIAASGPGERQLRDALSPAFDDYIKFIGPQPDDAWAQLLQISQVNLVTLRTQAKYTSVPSKTYSALAAGNAILAVAPDESDLAGVMRTFGCGRCVRPGDVDGLLKGFHDFLDDDCLQSYQKAVEEAAEANDIQNLAKNWEEIFDKISEDGITSWRQFIYAFTKRAFDLACSSAAIAALAPLLAGTAIAVAIQMGTPVLFKQDRPGLDGKPFKLLKFRSMTAAKPGEGAESDARRITKLGQFIRKTSIDELPSLFNVLKGDLSLVGPRPLLMQYLERYTEKQAQRHWVKPGITGLAQVNGRNALSWEEKFDFDVKYAHSASILMDAKILFKTIGAVFNRKNISHAGCATMPEFMGTQSSESVDETRPTDATPFP